MTRIMDSKNWPIQDRGCSIYELSEPETFKFHMLSKETDQLLEPEGL